MAKRSLKSQATLIFIKLFFISTHTVIRVHQFSRRGHRYRLYKSIGTSNSLNEFLELL